MELWAYWIFTAFLRRTELICPDSKILDLLEMHSTYFELYRFFAKFLLLGKTSAWGINTEWRALVLVNSVLMWVGILQLTGKLAEQAVENRVVCHYERSDLRFGGVAVLSDWDLIMFLLSKSAERGSIGLFKPYKFKSKVCFEMQ